MMAPLWLTTAKSYIGLAEIPGPAHNRTILIWIRKLGAWWQDDETAWCGSYTAHCIQSAGLPIPKAWYRAKAWADYGTSINDAKCAPGAILVFERPGGGHVGFYVGEDRDYFHVLGGNQSNGVNVTRIKKSRCIAARWPSGVAFASGPVMLTAKGAPISINEA